MAEQTTFTFELDVAQQERLQALLAVGNFKPRQVPYSLVAVAGDGFTCALYQKERHGRRKLCVQGGKARDFVAFFLEPNAVVPVSMDGMVTQTTLPGMEGARVASSSAGAPLPHGGSDESGKGDYFGPLVVA